MEDPEFERLRQAGAAREQVRAQASSPEALRRQAALGEHWLGFLRQGEVGLLVLIPIFVASILYAARPGLAPVCAGLVIATVIAALVVRAYGLPALDRRALGAYERRTAWMRGFPFPLEGGEAAMRRGAFVKVSVHLGSAPADPQPLVQAAMGLRGCIGEPWLRQGGVLELTLHAHVTVDWLRELARSFLLPLHGRYPIRAVHVAAASKLRWL